MRHLDTFSWDKDSTFITLGEGRIEWFVASAFWYCLYSVTISSASIHFGPTPANNMPSHTVEGDAEQQRPAGHLLWTGR
jgi:hypothetical protein